MAIITEFTNIHLPFHEKDSHRIWAFSVDFTQVLYSDDYGDSWTTWHTFGATKPIHFTLFRAANGDIYFSPNYAALWRLSADKATTEKVIDFYHPSATTYYSFLPWLITESNDGYIFVGQYTNNETYNVFQYVWVRNPSNGAWSRYNWFATTHTNAEHIHVVTVNAIDNTLYVTLGDNPKIMYYIPEDDFAGMLDNSTVPTKITDPTGRENLTGYTGITFTDEAVWCSDDLCVEMLANPAYYAAVWSIVNNGTPVERYAPKDTDAALDTPIYYLRAIADNPNELWLTTVDDNSYTTDTAIIKLTKADGVSSPWTAEVIAQLEGVHAGTVNYYAIAYDGNGLIPSTFPYVFINTVYWGAGSMETPVLRILREPGIDITMPCFSSGLGYDITYSQTRKKRAFTAAIF